MQHSRDSSEHSRLTEMKIPVTRRPLVSIMAEWLTMGDRGRHLCVHIALPRTIFELVDCLKRMDPSSV